MAPRRSMLLKIIILGDFGVGKTSIMDQFVDKKFSDGPKAMIGADFLTKEMHFENRLFILQIWDTAGMERFKDSIGAAFYRGVDCCVLTYDVNDIKSFESLKCWRAEFVKQATPKVVAEKFPFVLLGNKVDIDGGKKRMVEKKKARDWCKSNGNIPYFETSAKNGTNVEEVFQCIAKTAIMNETGEELYVPDTIPSPGPERQRFRCCQ